VRIRLTIVSHFDLERLIEVFLHHEEYFLPIFKHTLGIVTPQIEVEEAVCTASREKLIGLRGVLGQ